jgi:integrase
VRKGLRVGYRRKPRQAAGVWVCRLALPGNVIVQKALGAADDAPAHADGHTILSYAQAADAAQEWAREACAPETGGRGRKREVAVHTVAEALRQYAAAKRAAGQAERASEAETVLRRHVPASLAHTALGVLNAEVLKGWLSGLGTPKRTRPAKPQNEQRTALTQGRVDKVRGVMKAALRAAGAPVAATRDGLGAASIPNRVEPATRNVVLTRPEIEALIREIEARDPDLALFACACEISGARPGQLARCTLRDLDAVGGVLTIPRSAKGKPGTRKTRHGVPFPVGSEFAWCVLAQADTGPGGTGLLFHAPRRVQDFSHLAPRAPGAGADAGGVLGTLGSTWRTVGRVAWTKGLWHRTLRAAARAVGLGPDVTLYALRHSRAVALIRGGLSLREIAALLDTSAAMLERTYSRDIAHGAATTSRVRALLQAEGTQGAHEA